MMLKKNTLQKTIYNAFVQFDIISHYIKFKYCTVEIEQEFMKGYTTTGVISLWTPFLFN